MRELLADSTTDPSKKLFERYVRALFAVIRSNKRAKKGLLNLQGEARTNCEGLTRWGACASTVNSTRGVQSRAWCQLAFYTIRNHKVVGFPNMGFHTELLKACIAEAIKTGQLYIASKIRNCVFK